MGFLADPHGATFRSFREHYPVCAECAAEVRAFTELQAWLGASEEHPGPRELLAFRDAPGSLAAQLRARIADHLDRCESCRDELRALEGFRAEAAPAHTLSPSGALAVLERLRRLLWHPALAYALVVLLLVPLVADRLEEPLAPLASPGVVEEHAPPEERITGVAEPEALPLGKASETLDPSEPDELALPEISPDLGQEALTSRMDAPERERVGETGALERKSSPSQDLPAPAEQQLPPPGPSEKATLPEFQERAESFARPSSALESATPRELSGRARASAQRELAVPRPEAALAGEPERFRAQPGPGPLAYREEAGLLIVRIPVPPLAGELRVRVRRADGRGELVEHVRSEAAQAEIRVPASWLGAGRHRVEVALASDPPGAPPRAVHALDVAP